MSIQEGWQKADRPWEEYPIGTKARQSWEGGYWIKTERGWKWHNGSTFPSPGGANQVMLAAAPTPPAQDEPVAWIDEFGNVFPLAAWSGKVKSYLDQDYKNWKPLYTGPANDKLRKAAEEALKFLSEAEKMNKLGDYIKGMCVTRDNLRAALEGK